MISPISFGRAVKVNAPIEVANKIAKSANSPIGISKFDMFAKSIFTDTNIAKAKVVSVGSDEIYIFSGEEAKQRAEILKDLREKIDKKDELIAKLPDDEQSEKQKYRTMREKYGDIYCAIFQMRKMVENGKHGRPKSSINVQLKNVKKPIFGDCSVIDKVTYKSKKGSKIETIDYNSSIF